MGAFDHLPAAIRILVPEIETLEWPAERHADCSQCRMIDGTAGPWGFSAETRCCTIHPSLANFLAGRALRRGEPGRGRILARLASPEGVSAWGIDPPPAIEKRETETLAVGFGRDTSLRCPFWVGGEHTCGVWHDRSAICRSWYCKYEDGLAGAVAWSRISTLIGEVESRLALWAIERGDPPDGPAPAAAWAAWYQRAADLVEGVHPAELAPLRTERIGKMRAEVNGFVEVRRLRRRGLPRVLVPAISEMTRDGGDVLVTGYSSFDAVRAPAALFELLSRMDGKRPWRAALLAARGELGARGAPIDWLDDALIVELHRVGALRDPAGGDDLPYSVEFGDGVRWSQHVERKP